jgi:hypothetical protein
MPPRQRHRRRAGRLRLWPSASVSASPVPPVPPVPPGQHVPPGKPARQRHGQRAAKPCLSHFRCRPSVPSASSPRPFRSIPSASVPSVPRPSLPSFPFPSVWPFCPACPACPSRLFRPASPFRLRPFRTARSAALPVSASVRFRLRPFCPARSARSAVLPFCRSAVLPFSWSAWPAFRPFGPFRPASWPARGQRPVRVESSAVIAAARDEVFKLALRTRPRGEGHRSWCCEPVGVAWPSSRGRALSGSDTADRPRRPGTCAALRLELPSGCGRAASVTRAFGWPARLVASYSCAGFARTDERRFSSRTMVATAVVSETCPPAEAPGNASMPQGWMPGYDDVYSARCTCATMTPRSSASSARP